MSFRPPFRVFQAARGLRSPFVRQAFRPTRRMQTAAEGNVEPPGNQSAFQRFWNNPLGPKTVHFWAPVMKWAIVLAGIADFARPAESLSLSQNLALMGTGMIWTRWCFVIRPKNVFLATVNFFLFCVGGTQVSRILLHRQSLKDSDLTEEVKNAADEEKESAQKLADKA